MWWIALLAHAADPTLPTVVSAVPPVYPPEALAAGRPAAVLLELDVTSEGRVADARVVESAGEAFDAAAVQAARSTRFSPARGPDGEVASATITYRVTFEPTAAAPLSVTGALLAAGTRAPIAGGDVVFERAGERVVAVTDADGTFAVAGLAAGAWTVRSEVRGYREDEVEIEVAEGRVTELRLHPVQDRPWDVAEAGVSEEIVVVGEREAPEITERRLTQEEIRYLPGTAGDVVRVVQNLPGVARPPLGIGQLVIRGTAPEDSAYYLDGAPVPSVFHFSGLSTVLNGDAIAEIAFLPGNYGVRYGRTLGGVVDLRVDDALPERSSGYLSLDLFQATAFAEQRLGRSSITVSGRRSYVDAVLNPVLNGSGASTVRAPRYYDLQARMFGQTRSGGTLDALFLWSDDRFEVVGGGSEADETEETVQIGLSSGFTKLRLRALEPLTDGWRSDTALVLGPEQQSFQFDGDGDAYEQSYALALRQEVGRPPPGDGVGLGLVAGIDPQVSWFKYSYALPTFGDPEGAEVARILPSIYAETPVRLGALLATPGLRVDGAFVQGDGTSWARAAVDPRLALSVEVARWARLEGSFGGYSAFPTARQVVDAGDLGPARSWQSSVGVELDLGRRTTAELVAYDNWLVGLVSGREDAFRFFTGPPPVGPLDTAPYANDGTGRIYGVEGLVRYASSRTAALASVTLGRSTRVDRPGQEAELFEYDEPWVATVLASHELPRRWRLGARVRGSAGTPYTPVVNRYVDLTTRAFVPVYAAEEDGARLPPFVSLDVRVDKDFVYRNWTLTLYLDVQNATNRQNVEVMAWTDDYSAEDPITGLPLVPAFGVRGGW